MVTMEEQERTQYETQSQALRADLKRWENTWAKEHGGKKPARNDIKQNAEIAQKYKSYNKIRDILSGKIPPASQPHPNPRKRKTPDGPAAAARTPSKRTRAAETPVKAARSYADADDPASGGAEAATPSLSRRLFSPAVPTSIGPTPQRDGRVLGLFDLLAGSDADTPSRSRITMTATADDDGHAAVHATPRRQTTSLDLGDGNGRASRSPMSSGKRRMLDGFATPLKRRDGNAQVTPSGGDRSSFASRIGLDGRAATTPRGPGSASRLQFTTPTFLKRASAPLPVLDENGEYLESPPRPLRLPRKPLTRGLSSVVASLRKLEEEALDEDLEALREMEMDARGPAAPKPLVEGTQSTELEDVAPTAGKDGSGAGTDGAAIEVEDSQAQATTLLGGFDDEAAYDSPVEGGLDRGGQPLRVFKKKGQKRTTRLVRMKPTRTRRPAEADNSEDDADGDAVPETQLDAAGAGDSLDPASGSEFGGSDSEDGGKEMAKKKKQATTKAKAKAKAKAKEKEGKGDGKEEGAIKRTVRKVKATAHANFKRLKLKNHGAKGGPGYNSRFRRKR